MKREQKLLLISGVVLALLGVLYIVSMSVPNTAASAMLFPLSMLAVFFGIIFIIWSLAWMGLERTSILK